MRTKCVLIVDDEPDDREIFSTVLAHFGYRVDSAAGGAGALELFRLAPADLVITDLWMPGMSGYELLTRLRRESWVPVVALSASVMYPEPERALRAGFTAFVPKPCEPRALAQLVRDIIGEPSARAVWTG